MTLVRWDPIRDLAGIQERIHRMLADAPARVAYDEGFGAWVPPVDVFEKGDHLVIRAEVPGIERNDIDVRVENGVLQIRGERKADPDAQARSAYRLERVHGNFTRSFTLPTTVDANRISAKYRDGVLHLEIPKAESAMPKKVPIEAV